VQVGTGFQQVGGEAVAEHVGIHLFLSPGTAGGIRASVAGGFGIHGLIAAVPAISGKQPDTGSCAQPPPVRAELFEQDRAEHHVGILATFAALTVENHALAVHVADLQASQLRVPDASRVESDEHGAIKGSRSGVDELRYLFGCTVVW
jgi:hypothetical protein